MNLLNAQRLANELINQYGLSEKGWGFKFDTAVSRFGCCKHTRKTITLSKHLVSVNDESRVKDTILHEIAHALVGPGHGHDWVWKAKARSIGCTGNRCYTEETTKVPESKYIALCNGCGTVHKKHRRTKSVMACGICCKGRFQRQYVLDFKLNPKFI